MVKIAIVYWTGSGNTEKMAEAIAKGAKDKGAEVECINI
ncbi:MAG: flavodoxin domain-containing protein, partial [Synergistaceae bacterium]|nr:flavodoxin domain-containing protein [Synergistaceae bacterium]